MVVRVEDIADRLVRRLADLRQDLADSPGRIGVDQNYIVAKDDPTRVCGLAAIPVALAAIDAWRDLSHGDGRLLPPCDDEHRGEEAHQDPPAQADSRGRSGGVSQQAALPRPIL